MKYSQSIVAKKYARAYLQEFDTTLQLADLARMQAAIAFCRKHHDFISLVSLLAYQDGENHVLITGLFDKFALPISLKKLVKILIVHKRLIHFPQVLQDICCLYMQQNNLLEVELSCAQQLDDAALEQFKDFFQTASGKNLIVLQKVDESLIAGVRMQSDLFLWEYSIAARLRKLRQKLLIEG